jgi:hypothetical protein
LAALAIASRDGARNPKRNLHDQARAFFPVLIQVKARRNDWEYAARKSSSASSSSGRKGGGASDFW